LLPPLTCIFQSLNVPAAWSIEKLPVALWPDAKVMSSRVHVNTVAALACTVPNSAAMAARHATLLNSIWHELMKTMRRQSIFVPWQA
jgi:hypothetical protein